MCRRLSQHPQPRHLRKTKQRLRVSLRLKYPHTPGQYPTPRSYRHNRGLPATMRGGLGNEGRGRKTYGRIPESLFVGYRRSSPFHHGIHEAYPSAGAVLEEGSKPSSSGVSGIPSTRKYLSLSSQCSRTIVRNSPSSQYKTPVIGLRLNTTIL